MPKCLSQIGRFCVSLPTRAQKGFPILSVAGLSYVIGTLTVPLTVNTEQGVSLACLQALPGALSQI